MASPLTSLSSRCSTIPRSANFTNTRPMTASAILPATSFAKVKHEIPSSLLYSSLRSLRLCVNFLPRVFRLTASRSRHIRALAFLLGLRSQHVSRRFKSSHLAQKFRVHQLLAQSPARRKAQHLEGKARTSSLTWVWIFSFVSRARQRRAQKLNRGEGEME